MTSEETKSEGLSSSLFLPSPSAVVSLSESSSKSFEAEDTGNDELIENNLHV